MKISWIEPERLAASGIPLDAKDIRSLHEQGIRAILSLIEQPLFAQREITPAVLEGLNIAYFHVPVRDQYPPNATQAQQIIAIISAMQVQQRPLLIHCHAGIGRTGTILHLYYLTRGQTFAEAKAEIRRKRVQCILLSDEQLRFLQAYKSASEDNLAL
jgi:atypical dual specificity phosphatase